MADQAQQQPGEFAHLRGVTHMLAIASGKGGVGKTTTAVNLAVALVADGRRVGLLDADIYGPNLPHMLGIDDRPALSGPNTLAPLVSQGIKTMSIGYMIDKQAPLIWRGPMVNQALMQLLTETNWGELDYLIIDLPPGTGDVQLALSQRAPLTGAIIVTTPQDVALLDVCRGIEMFRKVGVPVIGVIENMALHTCSQCGHQEAIFGTGGAERIAAQFGVPVLGSLPLDIQIRENADAGVPLAAARPDHPAARCYREIAQRVITRVRDFATV